MPANLILFPNPQSLIPTAQSQIRNAQLCIYPQLGILSVSSLITSTTKTVHYTTIHRHNFQQIMEYKSLNIWEVLMKSKIVCIPIK